MISGTGIRNNFASPDSAVRAEGIQLAGKESSQGLGGQERTDFMKLVRIIREGGYEGYVPVETLLVRGLSYDPFAIELHSYLSDCKPLT